MTDLNELCLCFVCPCVFGEKKPDLKLTFWSENSLSSTLRSLQRSAAMGIGVLVAFLLVLHSQDTAATITSTC